MSDKLLIAYHGDAKLKEQVVAEAVAHRKADQYIKGVYWNEKSQKGCSVGCMLKSGDHSLSEDRWRIPQMLTRLQDCFFEGLPDDSRPTWTERYFAAIPVGADLSLVGWQFLHWNLTDNIVLADSDDAVVQGAIVQCRAAIKQCADVLAPLAKGEPIDKAAASAATRAAAWTAVWAADSAASVALRAARAAAWTAVWAAASVASVALRAATADSAAAAATRAADSAASRDACYVRMSEKLLELLAAAPVMVTHV